MDYFTQLLESYSKLKKRTLRLLSESENPEAVKAAQQAVAGAKNGNHNTANPFVANGARSKVAVFMTSKGMKFAPLASDGRPNVGRSKFVDQDFATLAGYFDSEADGTSEGPAEKKFKKTPAGENIATSEFGEVNPDEAMEAIEAFQNIAITLPNVYEGIDAKFKDEKWASYPAFSTYVFGRTLQSLESHILNSKVRISYDSDKKEYLTLTAPPDPKMVKEVAKNLEFLVNTLAKDNIFIPDKDKLRSMFAINSNGNVSVFSDIDDSGLVFSDRSGFFKMLLQATSEKFKVEFKTIDIKKQVSEGIDNNIRGVALEEILPILSMQLKISEYQKLGIDTKELSKGLQQSLFTIKDKLFKLMQNYESWITVHSNSALEPDEVSVINGVGAMVGPGSVKLLTAMVAASKDAISVRKPDFIIPKGKETGEGRRQDTLEVYSDFNKAKNALLKIGYTDEEIMLGGMIKTSTVEEVFEGRGDLYSFSMNAKLFSKGQQVFHLPISLKNYIELDRAVLGSTTVTSNSNFVNGISQDPQNLFLKKYQMVVGGDPATFVATHNKAIEYNNGLTAIWDKIGKVPTVVKARSAKGNLVQSKPFKDFIQNTLDIIKKSSTYKELQDDETDNPKAKLTTMISKYLSADEEDANLEDKIKAYTAQYTKNAKLINDIRSGSKDAKNYLAMKLFNTAGSVDDGLVCDYRGLGSKEGYNFRQNDIIAGIIQSFLKGDGLWTLKARNNSFVFYNTQNPKMRLTMADKVERRASATGSKYSTKTVVDINRDLMKAFNKRRKTRESLIDSYLEVQRGLLQELIT